MGKRKQKRIARREVKRSFPKTSAAGRVADAEAALHKSDVTGRFNYTGGRGNGKAVIARNGGSLSGNRTSLRVCPRTTRKFDRERVDSRITHRILVSHRRLGRSFHLSVDLEHRAPKPVSSETRDSRPAAL